MSLAVDRRPVPTRVLPTRELFDSEVTYLNTATAGLPPRAGWQAMQAALRAWQSGRVDPVAAGGDVETARSRYAALVGVPATDVAVGHQASPFVGLVAANLPAGAEVLTVGGEFTSVTFPFLAQQPRGVRVREVPWTDVVDAVRPGTTLVAVSLVQSACGRVLDLPALRRACDDVGARLLLDTTQAAGWLAVDAALADYTVCAGYKWLMAVKGTAFFTVRPDAAAALTPHFANWYGGADPWSCVYGSPLRLAPDASRFDVAPAWAAWASAVPALELLHAYGAAAVQTHCVGLADALLAGLGRTARGSAIVSLPVRAGVPPVLAEAGIAASIRNDRLRLAFHLPNDAADVARVLDVVATLVPDED